jgi:hypothetical protein
MIAGWFRAKTGHIYHMIEVGGEESLCGRLRWVDRHIPKRTPKGEARQRFCATCLNILKERLLQQAAAIKPRVGP